MNQSIKKTENEIKKIKEQRLVEESDNKLSEALFSNNPHVIDKSPSVNVIKIGKDKFVSVIKPTIIEEKNEVSIQIKHVKPAPVKNKCFDLNDYDYDYDYIEF